MTSASARLEAMLRSTDFYDGNMVNTFALEAAELSIRSQQQMVSLTTATQLRYMTEIGIDLEYVPEVPDEVRKFGTIESEFVKPRNVTVLGKKEDRLPMEEVFNRPAREYRAKVAKGMDESKALEHAVKRGKLFLGTNVSLAEREATFQILDEADRTSPNLTGWRRVIHPEASTSGVCGLCLAASSRLYTRENLKPLHDNCECEVLPVSKDNDPGNELNREDLDTLYDLAGGTAAKQLSRLRFAEDVHGELGAILVPEKRGQKVEQFTNPALWQEKPVDLDEVARQRDIAERNLPYMERTLKQFKASGRSKSDAAYKYTAEMAERYRAALSA
nr:hypothetical protein [Rhodococcus sp. (in: high G+C Gram-positive bacteria)]